MRLVVHVAGLLAAATLFSGCMMTKDTTEPATLSAAPASLPEPPVAARVDYEITQLGRTRNDPYNWLKDENWQEVMRDPSLLKPEIRGYLEAENTYTKARLEDTTTALRDELFNEMRGRIKEDDSSVPSIHGGWAYYTRFREGGEYAVYARKPAADAFTGAGEETILLDGDAMGKDQD